MGSRLCFAGYTELLELTNLHCKNLIEVSLSSLEITSYFIAVLVNSFKYQLEYFLSYPIREYEESSNISAFIFPVGLLTRIMRNVASINP